MSPAPRPLTLRPVWAVLALAALALGWIWLLSDLIRQWQMIYTYAVALLGGVFFVLWALLAPGLPRKLRIVPVAVVFLLGLFFFSLVRVRGVTGDWLPVIELRHAAAPDWRAAPRLEAAASDGDPSEETAAREAPDPPPPIEPKAAEPRPSEIDLSSPAAFPGFLGPNGDFTVTDLELERDWEKHPPRRVWQRAVGAGWAGFAIAGDLAFTLEQRGDEEATVAYELETGEQRWSQSGRSYFSNPIGGPGPRTTPAVSMTRVFSFGATGLLSAFERETGEPLWQHDVLQEHGGSLPDHGKTSSPLLVDGLVVVSVGGPAGHSLVAYREDTGELAWQGGDDASGYGSPQLAVLAGQRQILIFNRASVAAHAPQSGQLLWQYDWPSDYPNVAQPVVIGPDLVLFSTGYGIGSKLLRIASQRGAEPAESDRQPGTSEPESAVLHAELIWESPRLKAKFTNLALHQGYVYGLDDGVLACLDPETGERRWKAGRYGHGNMLLVGDVLLLQTEGGELVMIDPTPEEHRELTRFEALPGKAWNHFALVRPSLQVRPNLGVRAYLLVRNDQEAALWELPLR